MATLDSKIDFAVILRVTKANPNGDPLNGNRPRIDYDGYGEMSDVCIKRKIRDRLMEAKDDNGEYKYSIFVQSDERKVDDAKSLKDRADKVLKDNLTIETACKQWFDVRAFGQVFAFKSTSTGGVTQAFQYRFAARLLSILLLVLILYDLKVFK